MLTLDQIRAAQDNDLAGIRAVLNAMQSRINGIASDAARRLTVTNPSARNDLFEDFRQDAAVALFEALPLFDGSSVDRFYGYMSTTITAELKRKVHAQRNTGVGVDALYIFKAMLERADGDPYLAAKLAQTVPPAKKRLSADMAEAARLSWAGTASLDMPTGEDCTLGDTLAAPDDAPAEVRPKVGHGAALEALSVLRRYAGLRVRLGAVADFVDELPALVETLEDTISVPRDAEARRYVLDAMAVLRSAVSTATDGELTDDLRTAADDRADDRAAKVGAVRAVLNAMGAAQATVLCHSFGIAGHQEFGHGSTGDDAGLAEAIGSDVKTVRNNRTKALKAFARRWIKAVARDADHAAELEAVAAVNLGRGGRK